RAESTWVARNRFKSQVTQSAVRLPYMKDALRSLWRDLSELRAKREGEACGSAVDGSLGEEHWPWPETDAGALMRHFADVGAIDRLGDAADFALSHNATQHAVELLLRDIHHIG